MRRIAMVLVVALAGAGLAAQPAAAESPSSREVSAYAEALWYPADGGEHYLHTLAVRTSAGVSIGADGYAREPVTCADGSTTEAFTYFSGAGTGPMTVSGALDHAVVRTTLDLTYETLLGCPESVGQTVVAPDQAVLLVLDQVGAPLRERSAARIRIPGARNDSYIQRVDLHRAAGTLTIGSETRSTTSAGIERDLTVTHGSVEAAGVLTTPSFFADLAAVTRTRSTILQARGGLLEQATGDPAPGSVLSRYVDVTAETVDRTGTTVYALVVTDTVVRCADGALGVVTTERYGSATGTLTVGPQYRTAQATATVPLTLTTFNGCDDSSSTVELGAAPVRLDLMGTAAVMTAVDSRVFTSPPDVRGHERTVLTGRGSVQGTVGVGDLTVTPTFGGIGQRKFASQQVG
ncbi:hypothetical protein [Kribbella koreensis]